MQELKDWLDVMGLAAKEFTKNYFIASVLFLLLSCGILGFGWYKSSLKNDQLQSDKIQLVNECTKLVQSNQADAKNSIYKCDSSKYAMILYYESEMKGLWKLVKQVR
jgi:hypothetical protein